MAMSTTRIQPFHNQVNGMLSELLLPNDKFMAFYLDPHNYDSVKLESSATEFKIEAFRKGKVAARLTVTLGKNTNDLVIISEKLR